MEKMLFFAVMALSALVSRGAANLESDAMRSGKGALVLQVGSDWCVSGEEVRKAFESSEFRRLMGSKFVFGIHDEMANPTPADTAKNELVKSLLIRTKRFPAITC